MNLTGLQANLACVWEATARKPGNVHRYQDFADTSYLDFVASAAAIAPVMARAEGMPLGAILREGARLTRWVTRRNTNLGILLLLAPLAKAECAGNYRGQVESVLESLTLEDAAAAYAVIREANPGGLGRVEQGDVHDAEPLPLREAMRLAASRDLVARQYANGFAEVFDAVAPALLEGMEKTGSLEGGIVWAQLTLMSRYPDSLIARKRGLEEAEQAAEQAGRVLAEGWPRSEAGQVALRELDGWLREVGHARNPGTTADLLAAGLFVLLRQERLTAGAFPWSEESLDALERRRGER